MKSKEPKKKKTRLFDDLEQPVWCGICHVRIAPYEASVRVASDDVFHGRCLDREGARLVLRPLSVN
jgi:hypothetical protein